MHCTGDYYCYRGAWATLQWPGHGHPDATGMTVTQGKNVLMKLLSVDRMVVDNSASIFFAIS